GPIDLVVSGRAHGAEQLARGWAPHLDLLAVAREPLATDEGTSLRHHLSHCDLLRHELRPTIRRGDQDSSVCDLGDHPPAPPRMRAQGLARYRNASPQHR